METETKEILEIVNFIKDRMATKDDLAEVTIRLDKVEDRLTLVEGGLEKVDDRLVAVESRLGGIENRIDDGVFAAKDLEYRVRAVLPNLPQTAGPVQ